MTSGALAGQQRPIKAYTLGSPSTIELLRPFPPRRRRATRWTSRPGCDKLQATCSIRSSRTSRASAASRTSPRRSRPSERADDRRASARPSSPRRAPGSARRTTWARSSRASASTARSCSSPSTRRSASSRTCASSRTTRSGSSTTPTSSSSRGMASYCHRVGGLCADLPGDILLFRYGRAVSHGAIAVGDDLVVHAVRQRARDARGVRARLAAPRAARQRVAHQPLARG
jgi:hypothetical protein